MKKNRNSIIALLAALAISVAAMPFTNNPRRQYTEVVSGTEEGAQTVSSVSAEHSFSTSYNQTPAHTGRPMPTVTSGNSEEPSTASSTAPLTSILSERLTTDPATEPATKVTTSLITEPSTTPINTEPATSSRTDETEPTTKTERPTPTQTQTVVTQTDPAVQTTEPITQGTEPVTDLRTPITEEIRALWVATVYCLDYPSAKGNDAKTLKKELEELVDDAESLGFNTVFFQVRPTGDALYPSEIFPSSHWITGEQGKAFPDNFDILEHLITYAHSKDIAIHAWINPYRVTNSASMKMAESNPALLHPEWTFKIDGLVYYNPGVPEVSQLIADGVAEIVENYDIDGIVFDDYFYPEVDEFHHSSEERDIDYQLYLEYAKEYGSIADWRRANINNMISTVFSRIKSIDKDCLFGVAPSGIWNNKSEEFPSGSESSGREAYSAIFCDAPAWAEGGYIDYLSPQIYWATTNKSAPFMKIALWWQETLAGTGTPLIISYNAYSLSAEQTQLQIDFARQMDNYYGFALYNYNNIMSSQSRTEVIAGLGAFEIGKKDE